MGLVTFNNEIAVKPQTESWQRFVKYFESSAPGGGTAIWDALDVATKELLAFRTKEPNAADAKLRILVLTDGADMHSSTTPAAIIKALQDAHITVDAVVVGGEADKRLAAVTCSTNGGFFKPQNMQEAMQLFEDETLLCWHDRTLTPEQRMLKFPPRMPKAQLPKLMTTEQVLAKAAATPPSVLGAGIFRRPLPAVLSTRGITSIEALSLLKKSEDAATAAAAAAASASPAASAAKPQRGRGKKPAAKAAAAPAASAASTSSSSLSAAGGPAAAAAAASASSSSGSSVLDRRRTQRVMMELKNIVQSPMVDFTVFPCENNLFVWRVRTCMWLCAVMVAS